MGQIRRRQDTVEAFVINSRIRAFFRENFSKVGDLERLITRVVLGEATPRDLGALRQGLEAAHAIATHLASVTDNSFHQALDLAAKPLDTVPDIALMLANALVDNPPSISKEGSIFGPHTTRNCKNTTSYVGRVPNKYLNLNRDCENPPEFPR